MYLPTQPSPHLSYYLSFSIVELLIYSLFIYLLTVLFSCKRHDGREILYILYVVCIWNSTWHKEGSFSRSTLEYTFNRSLYCVSFLQQLFLECCVCLCVSTPLTSVLCVVDLYELWFGLFCFCVLLWLHIFIHWTVS